MRETVAKPMIKKSHRLNSSKIRRYALTVLLLLLVNRITAGNPIRGASTAAAPSPQNIPDTFDLSGVWTGPNAGDLVKITQQGASVSSAMLNETCTGGKRDFYIQGTIDGDKMTGMLYNCSSADSFLVKQCHVPAVWQAPFNATILEYLILGEYQGQYWVWDTDANGNPTNCRIDHYTSDSISLDRLDCGIMTFEQLAARYTSDPTKAAEEIALAKQMESGEKVVWTANQMAPGGFKDKVTQFQAKLKQFGYDSVVLSAYRPILYTAHFANIGNCEKQLWKLLAHSPKLGKFMVDSVNTANAEIDKHNIKHQNYNVGGLTVKVPLTLCYRPPDQCPHANEHAVDIEITKNSQVAESPGILDLIGLAAGFCRPLLFVEDPDLPHWQPISNAQCPRVLVSLYPNLGVQVVAHSPVNILVQDSQGRRIGHDPASAAEVNDFGKDLASYSGSGSEPQIVEILPNATIPGSYSVTGIGTGTGSYMISLDISSLDGYLVDSKNITGTAALDQPIKHLNYTVLSDYTKNAVSVAQVITNSSNSATLELAVANSTFDVQVSGGGLSTLMFSQEGKAIALNNDGSAGPAKLTIPAGLLAGQITVIIDGQNVQFSETTSQSSTEISLDKPSGSQLIIVEGTKALQGGGAQTSAAPSGLNPTLIAGTVAAAIVALSGVLLFRIRRRKLK